MKTKTKFIIGMATALVAAGILAGCGANKYKITFVSNSSQTIDPISIDWGMIPTLPETLTKEGYTFTGWYTDAGCKNPYTPAQVENNFTLYGGWSINSYTVTFVTGVEGLDVPSQTLKYGSKITVKNNIERDYYTFGGWFYDQEYTKAYQETDTVPGNNITFYAKWIENSFTITFDANNDDATGAMSQFKISETSESKALPLNKFKVTGMDFLGWSTTPDGEVEYLDGQDLLHVKDNNNFTLYAVWAVKSIKVDFRAVDENGILVSFGDVPEVEYGGNVVAPEETPTLVGHTFEGWGRMQQTTDQKANIAKVYYSVLNNTYTREFLNKDEDISGRTLYEVAKVELINETVKEDSKYYALFNRIKSAVSFVESVDGVEGEIIVTREGYYGSSISFTEVEKPAKAGYAVGGWYYDEECKNLVSGTGVSFNDTDYAVYLKYTHNAHILSYSIDGGNSFVATSRFFEDEINLPKQTKIGYRFLGWSVSPTSSEIYDGKMPDEDLTLYAVFEQKQYTITLHGAAEPYTQIYVYNQELSLGTASKTGYDFGGWYTDSGFSTLFEQTRMPDVDDLELFAKFIAHKHQISFDTDGGSAIATITNVEFDKPLKDLEIESPTKTGYAFVKWVDAAGDDVNLNTAKMGDADLHLKAIYSAQAVNVNIVYKGQDLGASTYTQLETGTTTAIADTKGFSISEASAKAIDGYVYEKSDSVDVSADGTSVVTVYYTRANYTVTFKGDGVEDTGISYQYGATVNAAPTAFYKPGYVSSFKVGDKDIELANYIVSGNVTINVIFTATEQKVTFNANGGLINDKATYNVDVATGEAVSFPDGSVTVRDGYTLLGWSLTADGDVIGSYTMTEDPVQFFAIWQVNKYDVAFVSAKGTAPETINADYGSTIASLPTITADGYTFIGYKNSKGESVSLENYIVPLGGDTLTAQWTENSVKVVFHGNGATTGTMSDQTIKYSGSKALSANAFTKTGYSFAGWALSATGEAEYANEANIVASFEDTTETVDLYAVWSINSYTITFDSNGGSNVSPITKEYNELFDAPSAPTRKGYTFIGWYTQKTGGEIRYPERMGAEDTTLYAHWQANSYSVIYDSNGGSPIESKELENKTQGYTLTAADFPSTEPSRTGYDFIGWFEFDGTYDADGNPNADWGRKITVENITSFAIDGDDVTFHAQWAVKSHNVTYYVPTGTTTWGEYKVDTYNYGEAIEKPADPTLGANETFVGWSIDEAGEVFFDFASDGFMGDSDVKLYAIISDKKYTIYYYVNDVKVYSLDSDAEDQSFLAYMKKLYGETEALKIIYEAINEAIKGNTSPITAAVVYSTFANQPNSNLYYTACQNEIGDTLADYAYGVLGPICGSEKEFTYYSDILNAAGTLQSADPSAINDLINNLYQKISDPIYAELLDAVRNALPAAMGGQDNQNNITALAAYATVAKTYTRSDLLKMFAEAKGASQSDAKVVVEGLVGLDGTEFADYFALVAEKGALLPSAADPSKVLEPISNATSEYLSVIGQELDAYEKNAYNPLPTVEGQYFDGWKQSVNDGNHSITYNAEFVDRSQAIEDIEVVETSTSSATFSWKAVNDCYGYRVEIYNSTTGSLIKSDVVTTNSYKMNGLTKGDSIKVVVTVLTAGSNGEYRAESKGYETTSLKDGSTITVNPSSLDSEPREITYVHTVENDIGKVSKAGDYYYITENEGVKTYIFFTNTTYGFTNRKLEIVTGGGGVNEIGKSSTNADAIITTNETGSFIFKIDGVTTYGIVRAMPDSFKSGAIFEKSESATVQPNAKDRSAFESADFLGAKKEIYKIGAASTSSTYVKGCEYSYDDGDNKYYNGFKFDVDSLSTVGKVISVDRDYKFYKIVDSKRVEVTDGSGLYFYNKANDLFFFKADNGNGSNLGIYEVEILAKADVADEYTNTSIPKAIKENATKMERFKKVIRFELNEGVNVYTSDGLRDAMANKSCREINIQTDIHAELAPNMYGYMPHLQDVHELRVDILNWKVDVETQTSSESDESLKTGDVDIQPETAVMTTEDGYGPKIFTEVPNGSSPAFKASNKHDIYYAGEGKGTLAIKSAKFIQNFDNGAFKILARLPGPSVLTTYNNHGYRTAQMFQRVDTGNLELQINGNYYDVSAADGLFCRSASKNTFAGQLATYEIQSCHQMIFINQSNADVTVKNLNVISNSNNVSAMLGETQNDVANIMRFTSGGISGFMSADYSSEVHAKFNLESINVTGALIGLYCDSGLDARYVHVKDSWANGVFGYCDLASTVSLSDSVIESSGGCAVQVDDQKFDSYVFTDVHPTSYITNPTANINYGSCTIENFVSGDEQWFKGYSMEVVALGLKTKIDDIVSHFGLTIIKERQNPVSGLTGEYMNWEFFMRTDGINPKKEGVKYTQNDIDAHPEDISTNMIFGSDYTNIGVTVGQLATLKGIELPEEYDAFSDAVVYQNSKDSSKLLFMKNITGEGYGDQPILNPVGETQSLLIEVKTNGSGFEIGNMHLFFRQNQPSLGWLQGMVQLFFAA